MAHLPDAKRRRIDSDWGARVAACAAELERYAEQTLGGQLQAVDRDLKTLQQAKSYA